MRITAIREARVPLRGAGSNAVVDFVDHHVSLVAVFTDVRRDGRPLVGVAFNSIGRHAQSGIIVDRMAPRVLGADPDTLVDPHTGLIDPASVLGAAMQGEKPGGHGDRASAAAAIELACWDLLARYHDEPAWATIAAAHGREPIDGGVSVYAAGGYYHDRDDPDRLHHEVTDYLQDGYPAVKIKIGGADLAEDLTRIETAVDAAGAGDRIAVDANGRFDVDEAVRYGEAIAPFGLRWYEEPVDPLDYAGLAQLAARYDGPIATGENLFSRADVDNLMAFGGLRPDRDILQMDPGLSYGLTGYAAMLASLEEAGFDRRAAIPHGGHLINLHIVTALGLGGCEAYPGVFEPFGGYSDDCRLTAGRVVAPGTPGFGLESKTGLTDEIERLLA